MKVLCSLDASCRPEGFDPIGIIRECESLAAYFFVIEINKKHYLKVYFNERLKHGVIEDFYTKLCLSASFEIIEKSGTLLIFRKAMDKLEDAIAERDRLLSFFITADSQEAFDVIIENAHFDRREIMVPLYKKNE